MTLIVFFCFAPIRSGGASEEFWPVDEYIGSDNLTGLALCEKILQNRFQAFTQTMSMRSGDESGNFQRVKVRLKYKRFDPTQKGIISKTITKYSEPNDVRHLGYLIINKEKGQDDQFVYRPSTRKVRRINVRGESVAGTDFAFEDLVPFECEDATHHRLKDETLEGVDTFVITMVPKPSTESEYSKIVSYVDKETFIPVQTWYWDNKRVKVKRMDADRGSFSKFEGVEGPDEERRTVWIAQKSQMTHLQSESFTELLIEDLEADPTLRSRDFSQRQLTSSR